jgi:hypothetical protein
MAKKEESLDEKILGGRNPDLVAAKIEDLKTQLVELTKLEEESATAYDARIQKMSLYQRSLFDDTERALKALKDRQITNADIEAEEALYQKARSERVNGTTAEARAAAKVEADLHLQRKKNLEEIKKIQDSTAISATGGFQKYIDGAKRAEEASKKLLVQKEKELQIEERLRVAAGRRKPDNDEEVNVYEKITGAMRGTIASAPELAKSFEQLSEKTAVLSMLMPGTGLDDFYNKLMAMPGEMDTSYRGMIRAGTAHTPELFGVVSSIIDPIGMIGEEFGTTLEASKNMLTGVGIFAPEAIEAMTSVKSNVMLFRKGWIGASEENRIAAETTANLVAGLKKLGVATDDSANIVNFLTKGLGETPAMADESLRAMENMAYSLDINVGQAFKDFIATQDTLAQYGTRNEEVFYNLEAQSVATGIEVTTLAQAADKLDTFKGAAQAAQGFNAVLGKTVLSVTDLVHAEPAEKIEMLKDAFDRSGMTFESSHRRIKSIVASMLSMSVADATQLFGSKEDYFDVSSGMNTTATEVEELEKRIKSSMNVSEKMQASMTNLGAANSKLVKQAREEAETANNFLMDLYANLEEQTGDSMESLISYMGQLKIGAEAQAGIRQLAIGGAMTLGAMAALEEMLKDTPLGRLMPSIMYRAEKQFGVDYGGDAGVGEFDGWAGKKDDTGGGSYKIETPGRQGGVTPRSPPGGESPRGFERSERGQVASAGGPVVVKIVSEKGVTLDTFKVAMKDLAGVSQPGAVMPEHEVEFSGYRLVAIPIGAGARGAG